MSLGSEPIKPSRWAVISMLAFRVCDHVIGLALLLIMPTRHVPVSILLVCHERKLGREHSASVATTLNIETAHFVGRTC